MNASKKCVMIVLVVALLGVVLYANGCKKRETAGSKAGTAMAASVELCTGCGQIKGNELCCKPGQATCTGCGLAKGSPGCCNIPEGAETAAICTGCGQIKGSELCCKPNQLTCLACGLVKGSPGCCKIPEM
ncbi:MAG: hypothetical protein ACYSW7_08195 [Planctomycetota bacterium]